VRDSRLFLFVRCWDRDGRSVCYLINPSGSLVCDCGYDFEAHSGGVRPPFTTRHRVALIVVGIVGGSFLLAGGFIFSDQW
jgi:hypothetical protein